MTKDDKINIKLEVCRDKTSGKLAITAHFNSNAPNVFQEKDGYFWVPTTEEKDLINEAFQLMPTDAGYTPSGKTTPKPEKEEKPTSEPVIEEEIKPTPEAQPPENEKKPAYLQPLEKLDESDIFEVTDKDIKADYLDKDIDKKTEEPLAKSVEPPEEEKKPEEPEEEKIDEDEKVMVEADSEAIEAALKKHTEKNKSIVEADEQTIIDKVLSQKKKGKWSRR